ncbi:hypothetical protein BWI17_00140 [Betaproteobacteria bacterium GR16-43]|nr:hypothetical protein BWI17_00140 [Betaproteobacteria bacterium GR16-43]
MSVMGPVMGACDAPPVTGRLRWAAGDVPAVMDRIVLLEEDVFRYVIQHARDFRDTPSQILRRLLRIEPPGSRVQRYSGVTRPRKALYPDHELSTAIDRASWQPFDIQRYLFLLKCLQHQRPLEFRRILSIRGRTRCYFARTAREIEASGTATQPRPIAGTPYWALTNIPTREKQRILRNVMTMLGYSEDAMLGAREYLARGRIPTMPG